MTRVDLFIMLLAMGCGYAFLKGGAPERIVAAILSVGVIMTFASESSVGVRYHHVEVNVLIIDVASLIAVAAVASRSARFWPLWMSALYVMQVLSHLVPLLPHMWALIYGILLSLWGYPILLLLVVATWRHQKRLADTGSDASWVTS